MPALCLQEGAGQLLPWLLKQARVACKPHPNLTSLRSGTAYNAAPERKRHTPPAGAHLDALAAQGGSEDRLKRG